MYMYFEKNYFGVQHLLYMSNGSKIDYVEQCVHLGTTLSLDQASYTNSCIHNMGLNEKNSVLTNAIYWVVSVQLWRMKQV